MNYIKALDRNQYQLMNCLDDPVSSNHPVRIIDKVIDSIVSSNKERFEKERQTDKDEFEEIDPEKNKRDDRKKRWTNN